LEDTIEELKLQVEHLTSPRKIAKPSINYENRDSLAKNNRSKKANAAEDEAWLFYCETSRTVESINTRLGFKE
jgi:hypothetical protein